MTLTANKLDTLEVFANEAMKQHRKIYGTSKIPKSDVVAVVNISTYRLLRLQSKIRDQLTFKSSLLLVTENDWKDYSEHVLSKLISPMRHGKTLIPRHPKLLTHEQLIDYVHYELGIERQDMKASSDDFAGPSTTADELISPNVADNEDMNDSMSDGKMNVSELEKAESSAKPIVPLSRPLDLDSLILSESKNTTAKEMYNRDSLHEGQALTLSMLDPKNSLSISESLKAKISKFHHKLSSNRSETSTARSVIANDSTPVAESKSSLPESPSKRSVPTLPISTMSSPGSENFGLSTVPMSVNPAAKPLSSGKSTSSEEDSVSVRIPAVSSRRRLSKDYNGDPGAWSPTSTISDHNDRSIFTQTASPMMVSSSPHKFSSPRSPLQINLPSSKETSPSHIVMTSPSHPSPGMLPPRSEQTPQRSRSSTPRPIGENENLTFTKPFTQISSRAASPAAAARATSRDRPSETEGLTFTRPFTPTSSRAASPSPSSSTPKSSPSYRSSNPRASSTPRQSLAYIPTRSPYRSTSPLLDERRWSLDIPPPSPAGIVQPRRHSEGRVSSYSQPLPATSELRYDLLSPTKTLSRKSSASFSNEDEQPIPILESVKPVEITAPISIQIDISASGQATEQVITTTTTTTVNKRSPSPPLSLSERGTGGSTRKLLSHASSFALSISETSSPISSNSPADFNDRGSGISSPNPWLDSLVPISPAKRNRSSPPSSSSRRIATTSPTKASSSLVKPPSSPTKTAPPASPTKTAPPASPTKKLSSPKKAASKEKRSLKRAVMMLDEDLNFIEEPRASTEPVILADVTSEDSPPPSAPQAPVFPPPTASSSSELATISSEDEPSTAVVAITSSKNPPHSPPRLPSPPRVDNLASSMMIVHNQNDAHESLTMISVATNTPTSSISTTVMIQSKIPVPSQRIRRSSFDGTTSPSSPPSSTAPPLMITPAIIIDAPIETEEVALVSKPVEPVVDIDISASDPDHQPEAIEADREEENSVAVEEEAMPISYERPPLHPVTPSTNLLIEVPALNFHSTSALKPFPVSSSMASDRADSVIEEGAGGSSTPLTAYERFYLPFLLPCLFARSNGLSLLNHHHPIEGAKIFPMMACMLSSTSIQLPYNLHRWIRSSLPHSTPKHLFHWSLFQCIGNSSASAEHFYTKHLKSTQLHRFLKEISITSITSAQIDLMLVSLSQAATASSSSGAVTMSSPGITAIPRSGSPTNSIVSSHLTMTSSRTRSMMMSSMSSTGSQGKKKAVTSSPGSKNVNASAMMINYDIFVKIMQQIEASSPVKDLDAKLRGYMENHKSSMLIKYEIFLEESMTSYSGILSKSIYERAAFKLKMQYQLASPTAFDSIHNSASAIRMARYDAMNHSSIEVEATRKLWSQNLDQIRILFLYYSSASSSEPRRVLVSGSIAASTSASGGVIVNSPLLSYAQGRELLMTFGIIPQIVNQEGYQRIYRSIKLWEWFLIESIAMYGEEIYNLSSSMTHHQDDSLSMSEKSHHTSISKKGLYMADNLRRDPMHSAIDPYDLYASYGNFGITLPGFIELLTRIACLGLESMFGTSPTENVKQLLRVMDMSDAKKKLTKEWRKGSTQFGNFIYR
jgi:hypothetical protein